DGIRDKLVTGVQTCALPISRAAVRSSSPPIPVRHLTAVIAREAKQSRALAHFLRDCRVASRAPRNDGAVSGIGPCTSTSRSVSRSEERRVGKECRSGWSAYH